MVAIDAREFSKVTVGKTEQLHATEVNIVSKCHCSVRIE